jgi:hypothetical protein
MTKENNPDMVWHDDGHSIELRINKSELEIIAIRCPGGDDRKCLHEESGCIVDYYLYRYGMECNAGTCPAAKDINICWTFIGDKKNLDMAQVWFMPKTDDLFSAWLISKQGN